MNASLKAAQLKLIAFKCGMPITGTKAIVSAHIQQALAALAPATQPRRILSIDVGIRNLAYCILDAALVRPQLPSPSPVLHAWECLAVASAPTPEDLPLSKEVFDPATLSAMAYPLLREKLLRYRPTHVLIERQRFRSHGVKFVLEWTLRVNIFEAILHAVLHTLRAEGVWSGQVESISPLKVGLFWLGEEIEVKRSKSSSAKWKNKRRKIALVRSWLEHGTTIMELGNKKMEDLANSYKKKWDSSPGRPKNKSSTSDSDLRLEKLDDLADALLQGLAWLYWEENKRKAANEGIEVLLNS